jgi:hypothetical protein
VIEQTKQKEDPKLPCPFLYPSLPQKSKWRDDDQKAVSEESEKKNIILYEQRLNKKKLYYLQNMQRCFFAFLNTWINVVCKSKQK